MKTNLLFIILIVLCLIPVTSFCNDSGIVAVGGTWVVMKGEHPSVQMERETIDINVYAEYYDVIAEFTFRNNGDTCSVYMGFPETGYGDMNCNYDSSCFKLFSTSVDGKIVEAKRELVKSGDDDTYLAYWIKQVLFKDGETKKVIVKYRSSLGSGISGYYQGSDNFISYTFSGGNWYGKVLESKLNIYFHIPIELREKSDYRLEKIGDHYTYTRTNWEAEEYFSAAFRIKD
jgi:hypothetical protein